MTSETTDTYKDWILDIIDQLRKRKARPDLERITHFVERKHGLGRKETEAHLEKLVDKGIVIKVVYKRGTSYRNATKSRKRSFVSNVLNSNLASFKINEAVNSILRERNRAISVTDGDDIDDDDDDDDEEPMQIDDDCEGVSAKEIEKWLKQNQEDIGPYPVHWAVQREVDAGRLSCLQNGNFVPFREEKNGGTSQAGGAKGDGFQGTSKPVLQKSMSVFAKRGRPPKLNLPKFNRSVSLNAANAAKKPEEPESAPVPVMPPHLCDFCQQSRDQNRQGQPEELLFCKDCNAKAHPSCMNYAPELAARARNTAWQCIDCKTCCICADPGEADCMLFCDACDKGYHMMCHVPKVDDKPQGKWICSECVNDGVDIDDIEENSYVNVIDSTMKSTDSESFTSTRDKNGESEPHQEVYPNATQWSITDVVHYFNEKGFSESANAFKVQEIDGQSLLLLKRSDVLQGLSLKLGPALKIYNHVMKLQTAGSPPNNE
ncbi:histone acetyltransferase KAT6B-like [Mercenaria mercenaria]|uniref:histone acetyltransferase KAT6B-like n=1 Tax=Mercenaria mercenaria TaxID=6596 RepID=UPI001E1D2BBB|nr:histone acetyltransferase KAT6B-like [Mercenaria mercenaria]